MPTLIALSIPGLMLFAQTAEMLAEDTAEGFGASPFQAQKAPLVQEGIKPYLDINGEVWANTSGGERTGAEGLFQAQFGFALDLNKLADLEGWTYAMDWHAYYGSQPSISLVGLDEASAISNLEAQANVVRFRNISLQRSFNDGQYLIRFGQLAADDDFMVSETAGLFLNGAFGPFPAQARAVDAPIYPLSAPGIYFYAEPAEDIFMQLGVYTANAGEDNSSNWGFGWEINGRDGAAIFYEIGTQQTPFNLPGTYTLGVFASTGDVTLNTTGETDWGVAYPYVLIDQAFLTDREGNPVLSGFFRFTTNFQHDRTIINVYTDAGLAWYGPIPGREDDTAGVAINFGSYERDYLQAELAAGNDLGAEQTIIELTYLVQVTDWFSVQPDLQIVLDPHNSRRDAWVVGLRGSMSF
ncbi:MAG: carbohydrate porin [Verrucomicrobiota bacterium]